jgi:hypothetical protein
MTREPADLVYTQERKGISTGGGRERPGISRARFLKLGAAGYVGTVLEGTLETVESSGLALAEPVSGGLYDERIRGQIHFSPGGTG